jgi:hypothetical protein
MHSLRFLRCIFALTKPTILFQDQPIIEVTRTVTIRNKYAGGSSGGEGIKLAVKLPYRSTVRYPDGASTGKDELRPKS